MSKLVRILPLLALSCAPILVEPAAADDQIVGYLCCNRYSDGYYISDTNISGPGQHMVPVGAPIRVKSTGKFKLKVVVENKTQDFDNEFSRDLSIQDFAKRYIVTVDPMIKIRTFPKNIQNAIADGHLVRGMTREQTLMSIGYPSTDKIQYRVKFDSNDRVADVENVVDTKAILLVE